MRALDVKLAVVTSLAVRGGQQIERRVLSCVMEQW